MLLGIAFSTSLTARPTDFTYKGHLKNNRAAASGVYGLRFELFDSLTNGVAVGVLTNAATEVSEGLFTATLDSGTTVFDDADLRLEVAAREQPLRLLL